MAGQKGESMKKEDLIFDADAYTVETMELEGKKLIYRAFKNIPYIENPADPQMQRLSIYAPEAFFHGEHVGPYCRENAPVFFPNSVGGYMPGPVEKPGKNHKGQMNTIFRALLHGYVVVSAGVRGRCMKNAEGNFIGMAPAAICDLKAAVRYLRHNKERIPGDVEKIISNGTSAGGALSSLLGATGNHPDYAPYLKEMGAAREEDHIFAASCYCPITNLEHADMAYEWEFHQIEKWHGIRFNPPAPGEIKPQIVPAEGVLTERQKKMSEELKSMFPAYLNSLYLKDSEGRRLVLDEEGNGSFQEYFLAFVAESAQRELDRGNNLSNLDWLTVIDGKVTSIDFWKYVEFRTRMKEPPAFDNVSLGTPEHELFGNSETQFRHFTEFGQKHDTDGGQLAEPEQVKMMNPMNYIGDIQAKKAEHYRIRHGAVDRDTSLAVPVMLAAMLENHGVDVELRFPWGIPHAGDYDLEELFAWIDGICG